MWNATARAAGFRAYPVRVVSRESNFSQLTQYDPTQFTAMVGEAMIDGKRRFFDPATLYCPFEILPWTKTASSAN